ncbi:GNAT family N-acetyltransferase [Cyanobium sp. Aljojuca 7D2]|uniref:GNAT family N-acetyltransferase n=1 Tax=Cyanobium sp. Aljojuca 7D2 TaxID=2823698 RepID=UPI0020CE9908|nr:GNAT family N-acetyltransferase [Cyanobium sp. Aljojuca 7D2]MCP9890887.1 GNAT family N-acetyltransferase [Cyanobium sp. Aljojuca 7D2]
MTILPSHLETQRLLIRPFHEEDLASFIKIRQDKDFRRFMQPETSNHEPTCEELKQRLSRFEREVKTSGLGPRALTYKQTGKVAGFCGIIHTNGAPDKEIIYFILPELRRINLCLEAASCVIKNMQADSIGAFVETHNTASLTVLKKLGFKYEGDIFHPFQKKHVGWHSLTPDKSPKSN